MFLLTDHRDIRSETLEIDFNLSTIDQQKRGI
jgi:hypothetical protein